MQTPDKSPSAPQPTAHTPTLRADNISFAYAATLALSNVSFAPRAGEILAIVGPNGSGKSTLLGVLLGALKPTNGTVYLKDKPLAAYPPDAIARAIAYVPQRPTVAFGFTVEEVVLMGRWPHRGSSGASGLLGLPGPDDAAAVTHALAACDITHLAHRRFRELSGGEQQRACLARALAQQSPIMLLDEPMNALDLRHQLQLSHLLQTLASGGSAIVLVTHDLRLAASLAQQIALMDRGKLKAVGTPSQVLTPQVLEPIYGVKVQQSPAGLTFALPPII
ncbi:MAG: ABC transporter ATP-binding protein [Phycisphaerales bacterium]|nr:ABC transporter ATP-binding protein [Phycisphaerales bacterium]